MTALYSIRLGSTPFLLLSSKYLETLAKSSILAYAVTRGTYVIAFGSKFRFDI
jgi:hypothetical protein